jgi:hypothetical protein
MPPSATNGISASAKQPARRTASAGQSDGADGSSGTLTIEASVHGFGGQPGAAAPAAGGVVVALGEVIGEVGDEVGDEIGEIGGLVGVRTGASERVVEAPQPPEMSRAMSRTPAGLARIVVLP